MRNLILRLTLILVVLMFCFSGCEAFTEDGIDPNRTYEFEKRGKAGVDALKALSILIPGLVPVASGAACIYATWKKMKPKLTEAQIKENMANNAGMVLAQLVERIKEKYPETWEVCKADFRKAIGVGTVVEETIRGFRGLKPK